ncbi:MULTISPECIES: signal peptidase I [Brochothrix]|uniref:Signal peptidase I n=1 Tax=Brochothrix thermosphacta TaxID=2756 RepID=A0A1D2L5Z0_BROTH|nr:MULTISPECIES: signal peptidase I [Brochothrix]SLM97512.1 Signal peptidase I [Brachybacterium faecium]ANZ94103.1 signal peptidase I [Brochothrix thermosphacta]ANZ97599.1 signal peptidase I [Brochothrix thermosphacta]ATF27044.1 signal peptidase I [Brochothrix thermosphacta]ATH86402.1 signal peptidase I [Brochothrix thermosphacta]
MSKLSRDTKYSIVKWFRLSVVALILCLIVRFLVFVPVTVDGYSMMPTLKMKEVVLVNRLSEVHRFDTIVFNVDKHQYVKRVIGMPGDHIVYKNDKLYVNGVLHKESYLQAYRDKLNKNDTFMSDYDITVDPNTYYVLGDNRDNSNDSRYFGTIPTDSAVGVAKYVYLPLNEMRVVK